MSYKITIQPETEPLPPRDPGFDGASHGIDHQGNRIIYQWAEGQISTALAQLFKASVSEIKRRIGDQPITVEFPIKDKVWRGTLVELLDEMAATEQAVLEAQRKSLHLREPDAVEIEALSKTPHKI